MERKRQQINQWLQDVFGDQRISEYELNEKTVLYLHQLSVVCQRNDKNTNLMAQDLQQKSDEYTAVAQRISAVLNRLTISPTSLTQSCTRSLLTLTKLAQQLQIKDASDTCYYLALQDLDAEVEKVEEQNRQEAKRLKLLREKLHKATVKFESLERSLQLVKIKMEEEKPQVEKRGTEATTFLKNKAKDYAKEYGKMEASKDKVDPSLTQENLLKKSENLEKLKAELTPLKEELQSYYSLPPNLPDTKLIIEQKREELDSLEKQLAQCVDLNLS